MVYISILQVPLLLYVAMTDVAIRTISNRVCVAIAAIGIISLSTNPLQLAELLGVAVMLFLLLLTMHSRGWVGGGDVKLLAALTIGLSLTQLMQLLTVMALAGVGLAMAHMMLRSLSFARSSTCRIVDRAAGLRSRALAQLADMHPCLTAWPSRAVAFGLFSATESRRLTW